MRSAWNFHSAPPVYWSTLQSRQSAKKFTHVVVECWENTRRPECSCRVGTRCPIGGKCLNGDIVQGNSSGQRCQMADPTAIFSYFWRIFFRMAERFLWFSAISTKNYENSEWKFAHLLIWRNLSVKWRKIFILLAEAPFSFMVTLGKLTSLSFDYSIQPLEIKIKVEQNLIMVFGGKLCYAI